MLTASHRYRPCCLAMVNRSYKEDHVHITEADEEYNSTWHQQQHLHPTQYELQ